jgi:hypothetical protein
MESLAPPVGQVPVRVRVAAEVPLNSVAAVLVTRFARCRNLPFSTPGELGEGEPYSVYVGPSISSKVVGSVSAVSLMT